jgi:hypothetical protein
LQAGWRALAEDHDRGFVGLAENGQIDQQRAPRAEKSAPKRMKKRDGLLASGGSQSFRVPEAWEENANRWRVKKRRELY